MRFEPLSGNRDGTNRSRSALRVWGFQVGVGVGAAVQPVRPATQLAQRPRRAAWLTEYPASIDTLRTSRAYARPGRPRAPCVV
eukprot:122857-Chlamydomonas_euryale.AAC.2